MSVIFVWRSFYGMRIKVEGPEPGAAVNVVERFAEAFNRRDVDGLLACFTADATYRDLFYGPHAGQAALRGMFERMFHEGRDYRWQMDAIVMDARPGRRRVDVRLHGDGGRAAQRGAPRSLLRHEHLRAEAGS